MPVNADVRQMTLASVYISVTRSPAMFLLYSTRFVISLKCENVYSGSDFRQRLNKVGFEQDWSLRFWLISWSSWFCAFACFWKKCIHYCFQCPVHTLKFQNSNKLTVNFPKRNLQIWQPCLDFISTFMSWWHPVYYIFRLIFCAVYYADLYIYPWILFPRPSFAGSVGLLDGLLLL